MDRLIERCAGLDVHKKTVAACVRTRARRAAPAADPHVHHHDQGPVGPARLAGRRWVTVVGVESTGADWKAV
jgi:transposase